MKKISEMTLEELQDHAVKQAEQITALSNEKKATEDKVAELQTLNTQLQKRNNELFLKVEQGTDIPGQKKKEEPVVVESCEEYAKKLILGGNK